VSGHATAVLDLFGAPDARSLSPQERAELRREVIVAVRDGLTRLEAARRFGVSRRTVGLWMRAYQAGVSETGRDRPDDAPTVPAPMLTLDQELTVLRLMRNAHPSQLGLDGHLWTRRSLAEIIRIETGHRLPACTVDHYLNRWHLASAPATGGPGTLHLSCHTITPPAARPTGRPPPPAQTWPVLVAESGRGAVHFRLSDTAIGFTEARAFGRHLTQQHPRSVQLSVWRWPHAELETLHAWQEDPGPGLSITVGASDDLKAFPESGYRIQVPPDHFEEGRVARRGHSAEFRRKVLDLVETGRSVAAVAADLGISPQTIYVWRRQDRIDSGIEAGLSSAERAELAAAKRRITELETELAIHRRSTEPLGKVVPLKGGSKWSS
jgi:transposase-like protein